MKNKRKASIDDILRVKRMIKLHTAILSNKKVVFTSDNGETNEVSDIIGSAIIAFNYKIILKDKTNYTRTIEQTENIIKTIMILVEWLNGKDIAFNSEKRNKLRKCVSIPLITTWSCDKYEVLFDN